jgi:hypothetical protein
MVIEAAAFQRIHGTGRRERRRQDRRLTVRRAIALAGSIIVVALWAGCGGGGTPTAPATPVATPTPPIDNIEFASSVPSPGGVVHTGLPDPARTLNGGVTTGLTMTFVVASAVDRAAKLQVILAGAGSSVCLTNAAPVDVSPAPLLHLTAGAPQAVTITRLLLTSECFYPNHVTKATARLVPPSAVGTGQPAFYEKHFTLEYTVVQ